LSLLSVVSVIGEAAEPSASCRRCPPAYSPRPGGAIGHCPNLTAGPTGAGTVRGYAHLRDPVPREPATATALAASVVERPAHPSGFGVGRPPFGGHALVHCGGDQSRGRVPDFSPEMTTDVRMGRAGCWFKSGQCRPLTSLGARIRLNQHGCSQRAR
jgi:hypothetical protein